MSTSDTPVWDLVDDVAQMVQGTGVGFGPWNHLSCREVRPLENLLRGTGHREAADALIADHCFGDDDEHDVHHALYLWSIGGDHRAFLEDSETRDDQREAFDTYKSLVIPVD